MQRVTALSSSNDVLPIGTITAAESRLPRTVRAFGLVKGRNGRPADVIVERDVARPVCGDYDVLVQVMAASLNFNASWAALGRPVSTFSFPLVRHRDFHVLGSDASGIVVEIGSRVRSHRVGDAVVMATGEDDRAEPDPPGGDTMTKRSFLITGYENPDGTFAQFVRLDERQALPKPPEMPWEHASSYMLVGATSWRAIGHRARVEPGACVLVWGGSKGTGIYAVQIARHLGARHIIAVVSDCRGRELALAHGATETINRRELPGATWGPIPFGDGAVSAWRNRARSFVEQFMAKTGGVLADVVVEHPGAETYPLSAEVLAPDGLVTHFAGTTGYKLTFLGKPITRPRDDLLADAGLVSGARVLIYGADDLAFDVLERVRRAGARAVVAVSADGERDAVLRRDPSGAALAGVVDLREFEIPDDMPVPPHPDVPNEDELRYEEYRKRTLDPFRNAVRSFFDRRFPDLVIERAANSNTLDLSVFTVKPHGAITYLESCEGRRYAFDARFVWMFQKRILPWIVGTHYANHAQTREFNELVLDGKIRVLEPQTFQWHELPAAQQLMCEGRLERAKAAILVGASGPGLCESTATTSLGAEHDTDGAPRLLVRRFSDCAFRDVASHGGESDGGEAAAEWVGTLLARASEEAGVGALSCFDVDEVRALAAPSAEDRVRLRVEALIGTRGDSGLPIAGDLEVYASASGRWKAFAVFRGSMRLREPGADLGAAIAVFFESTS